jgi:RimJ/RimL family protein N-acetyltransferase
MDLVVKTLAGEHVTLEPIEEGHREALRRVAEDEEIWTYMPLSVTGDMFDDWFNEALENFDNKQQIPFVVRRKTEGAVVGSTRYLNLVPEHDRLEIGYTFYAKEAQGTKVNPNAKLLLLAHAFEVMGAHRVALRCDALNARSRAAITKLGAQFEGILRGHMLMPAGRRRDTAVFSILKAEWPAVRTGLEERLSA